MSRSEIPAQPFPLSVDFARTALVIIDMQRDFLEPGGFGAALGNDVSLLNAAVEPCRAILAGAREAGMLIGAQAFQTTPVSHAPAIVLALTPHLAAWAKVLIDGALGAAGTNAGAVGIDKMANMGVLYHGLELLGGGAILSGLVLGAIAVFIIEKQFLHAAAFAGAGAILTYFGLMHGEAIGIGKGLGVTPSISLAYAMVAGFLCLCSRSLVGAEASRPMISEPQGALEPAE